MKGNYGEGEVLVTVFDKLKDRPGQFEQHALTHSCHTLHMQTDALV